jgi:hypothetical protein
LKGTAYPAHSLSTKYFTEKEVAQWLLARRGNFLSKSEIEEKTATLRRERERHGSGSSSSSSSSASKGKSKSRLRPSSSRSPRPQSQASSKTTEETTSEQPGEAPEVVELVDGRKFGDEAREGEVIDGRQSAGLSPPSPKPAAPKEE